MSKPRKLVRPWADDERAKLRIMFEANMSMPDMAKALSRTVKGTRTQVWNLRRDRLVNQR